MGNTREEECVLSCHITVAFIKSCNYHCLIMIGIGCKVYLKLELIVKNYFCYFVIFIIANIIDLHFDITTVDFHMLAEKRN